MLRPIAAGLLCLGFVTLGVTLSRGQEAAEKPRPADPAAVTAAEENPVDAKRDNVILEIEEIDNDRVKILAKSSGYLTRYVPVLDLSFRGVGSQQNKTHLLVPRDASADLWRCKNVGQRVHYNED